MKNVLFHKKSLVAITLAAATLVTPLTASANDFSNRRGGDAGAQIAGGLIGGSLGAIIGEDIAGRGNRTEGAIIGAIIGGVSGAAIGEKVADNNKTGFRSNRRFNNRRFNNRFSNRGFRNRSFRNRSFNGGFRNRGFNNRGFNNKHSFRNVDGYGKKLSANIYHEVSEIDYRIDVLKHERRDICEALIYNKHDRYLNSRLDEIDYELDALKDRRHYLKGKKRHLKRVNY